jgi:hypothetical protein
MSTDKNPLEMAQELADAEFSATIEDNAFVIRPAEAGIALLASITTHNTQLEDAWASADALAARLEELRAENGLFRQELENVSEILTVEGYSQYIDRINRILWPVVGINEDGTEVAFEYNENQD